MNVNDGTTYDTIYEALKLGENPEDLVEVVGTKESIEKLSNAVKAANKAEKAKKAKKKRKQTQKSRRANRK